ncbi:MAG: YigZ family protein [Lachnospiraceae bacterium]
MEQEETMTQYRTIMTGGMGEIIEKKSRFIATLEPIASEQEAKQVISAVKKTYRNATHYCYAWVVGEENGCSDDGEPSGTAGRPILNVLQKEGLSHVIIVVTRYFGGTLLGTGGLIRAYTEAAKNGLLTVDIVSMIYGSQICITMEYNDAGKIQHLLETRGFTELEITYTDKVQIQLKLAQNMILQLQQDISEITAARAITEVTGSLFFVDK